jgi:HK97 family phage major capsid protein
MSVEAIMKSLELYDANVTKLAAQFSASTDELNGRLTDLEQKGARRGGGDASNMTVGWQVAASDQLKAFAAMRGQGKVNIPVKNVITSGSDSGGALVVPDRAAPVGAVQRRMTIRDLLPKAQTSSNLVEYPREADFANEARIVTEGTQKPESDLQFELMNAPVRTIAHFMVASRQIVADAPALTGFINNKLLYGLKYKEELQLLKGDGVGQNLTGLMTDATIYSPPFTPASGTRIDELGLAIAQLQASEMNATGIILNPLDWWKIVTTKDQIGLYVFANPLAAAQPTLWGLPVVTTMAMDEGEFMVGDFQQAAMIFDRDEATIELSTEDRDNFVKNLVTILCEERLAFAVFRPDALITGEFQFTS